MSVGAVILGSVIVLGALLALGLILNTIRDVKVAKLTGLDPRSDREAAREVAEQLRKERGQ
jgi:hypothetical protein